MRSTFEEIYTFFPTIMVAITLVAASTAPSAAQSGGPFGDFLGAWSGTGTIARQDGNTERIRCTADYQARGESTLKQTLSCKSDTTQFNLENALQSDSGKLFGEWVETTRNARGNVGGKITKDTMQGTAKGPGFTASIAVAVKAGRQSVSIKAQGGDISNVSIALVRAGR